ncbi:deoxyribodipyrimidine photo-lyase [Nonlabens antarcticus]|uniref:deoxyribodipyrimidine photo-lyase n=1 Tax=Nonlabens antarcticus TaxID=392714 RepID=UPI001891C5CD|nr:deoxyribodipyrimidine photo-lyase [Nonlabens antarcticus]
MNVYWFKRDFRLTDLEGLSSFSNNDEDLLLVYIYEPWIWEDSHYSRRHLDFIKESLTDMNSQLEPYNTQILAVSCNALDFFERLNDIEQITAVHSSVETGLDITYKRDKKVKNFFTDHKIVWKEFQTNGVFRGIKNRDTWSKDWFNYMNQEVCYVDLKKFAFAKADRFFKKFTPLDLRTKHGKFQLGGSTQGQKWMDSFFEIRLKDYSKLISKPLLSRYGCSRLSPYISWGNISIR